MSGIWSNVTAVDMRARVEQAQLDLEGLVQERRGMRRDVPERDAISYGYDLAIYAANARVETMAIMLAWLEYRRLNMCGIDTWSSTFMPPSMRIPR